MRIVTKKPGLPSEVVDIENELKALQGIVGSPIEIVGYHAPLLIICDEEGKLKGKEPNIRYGADCIAGTLIITAAQGEDLRGLTEAEICEAVIRLCSDSLPRVMQLDISALMSR